MTIPRAGPLKAPNNYLNLRGVSKKFLPPAAAEYSFEIHVILTISQSEIVKMTCISKHHSARSAVKNLFTQLQTIDTSSKIIFWR
jgi:hypothetical protein